MPNFGNIATQAETLNQQASALVLAIRAFQNARAPGGDALTPGQRATLHTNFVAALTAVEIASAAIRTELAL